MVVETEWMAAAETRMPTATKALAEREASMDGKVRYLPWRRKQDTVATEFVGTSVTSEGVSYDAYQKFVPENLHVSFFESRERGYVRVDATPALWRTDLRVMSTIAQPAAASAPAMVKLWVAERTGICVPARRIWAISPSLTRCSSPKPQATADRGTTCFVEIGAGSISAITASASLAGVKLALAAMLAFMDAQGASQ